MSRVALLRHRAGAQRALFGLVAVLVAGSAAAVCATFGVVRAGDAAVGASARPAVVAGAGVPVALLALAVLVTLTQAGTLLAQARATEAELLVSRGAAPGQLAAAGIFEVGLTAVGGAAVGWIAAIAGLALAGKHPEPAVLAAGAAIVAALAVVVLGGAVALQAFAAARRAVVDRSGRVRRVVSGGLLAVTVVAAGLCLAQLLRYGSPLVTSPAGPHTDPLAAAAPALVLAVLAVLAAGVLGAAARLAEQVAARSPGLAVLTVRGVGRRLVATATPLVLLVLAGGTAGLAGLHAGTTHRLSDDVAMLAAGADLRVEATGLVPLAPGGDRGPAHAVTALDGVRAVKPVLRLDGRVGALRPVLLGVPAGAADDVVRTPRPGDLAALGAVTDDGPEPFAGAPALPEGATRLDVTVTAEAAPLTSARGDASGRAEAMMTVTLWLADPDGALVPLALGVFRAASAGSSTVPLGLPAPLAPGWHLAAVDAAVAGGSIPEHLSFRVDGVTAVVAGAPQGVALEGAWTVAEAGSGLGPADRARGLAIDAYPGASESRVLRLEPRGQGSDPLPAVLARPLADDLGLASGDLLDLAVQNGRRLPLRVAAVVDAVPGALQPHAIAVGLGQLSAALLHGQIPQPAPAEAWAATDRPATPALVRAAAAVSRSRVVTPATVAADADVAGPVRAATAVAAVGTSLLATEGVALAAVVTLRDRRGEVVSLRAVGVGPRAQARSRAAELVALACVALVVGLAGGGALAALVVPGLARTTIVGLALVPGPVLAADATVTTVLVAVLVAGVGAVCVAVRVRVAAQARDTTYHEEAR